jgi:hypothetical protein
MKLRIKVHYVLGAFGEIIFDNEEELLKFLKDVGKYNYDVLEVEDLEKGSNE